MHDRFAQETERFMREARVLATLSHPGVVRHVAHGATPEGEPYLVMEWLEGETLSDRFRRAGLSIAESLALGRRLASALGAVHRAGIIHRDIKPSNVFLPQGSIAEAPCSSTSAWPAALGCYAPYGPHPGGYGPPHQDGRHRGARLGTSPPSRRTASATIDARSQYIFSLGCVLFKSPDRDARNPFTGEDALLRPPPRSRSRCRLPPSAMARGNIPRRSTRSSGALDVQGPRAIRPRDGDAAVAELGALGAISRGERPPRGCRRRGRRCHRSCSA